jgi:hypothetical protein
MTFRAGRFASPRRVHWPQCEIGLPSRGRETTSKHDRTLPRGHPQQARVAEQLGTRTPKSRQVLLSETGSG